MSDATAELTALSQQILTAIQGRDGNALGRLLHADFVHVNEAGVRTTHGAFVDAVVSADHRIRELSFEFLNVDTFADAGVVCGVQRAVVALASGEEMIARSFFTDLCIRSGANWQVRMATSSDLP